VEKQKPAVVDLVERWPAVFTESQAPDVTALRAVVLKGMSIWLGDDCRGFYKTCFAPTGPSAEDLSQVTVGVLTVLPDDAPKKTPNTVYLEPISTAIVLEGGVVMDDIRDLPRAVCLLFGLTYALHLDYPKCMEKHSLSFKRSCWDWGKKLSHQNYKL